jgi:hypothetical protein
MADEDMIVFFSKKIKKPCGFNMVSAISPGGLSEDKIRSHTISTIVEI